ncbi:Os10g0473600 [Oryza sativa Japonica Group]|uniref:Os10g0473600 protein n=1 Tax=Oryza sativa subsp. japonica TaxID=39947 RepID=A0A0P0XVN0_ORYSJ|nr:hypothetical protein EE612_051804 [Oryza sativa]BAT11273.1 Os10g0473600 [Oryza sativa Japonica Group]
MKKFQKTYFKPSWCPGDNTDEYFLFPPSRDTNIENWFSMTGEVSHKPGMICQFLNSPLKPLEMLPLPIPPSGTPCEADGLHFSLVNGSIGAFCKHSRPHFITTHNLYS